MDDHRRKKLDNQPPSLEERYQKACLRFYRAEVAAKEAQKELTEARAECRELEKEIASTQKI